MRENEAGWGPESLKQGGEDHRGGPGLSSPGSHGLSFLDRTEAPDGPHQAVPLAVDCLDSVRTDKGLLEMPSCER